MAAAQNTGQPFIEFLGSFDKGINSGIDPLLLPQNQLSYAVNMSARGTFAHPRPPVITRTMTFPVPDTAGVETAVKKGLWQGAAYYRSDTLVGSLIAQISGRLFQFTPQANNTVAVTEITVIDPMTLLPDPNSATAPQAWLWQAEKWMIVQNGVANINPIFFNGTTSARSNYSLPVLFSTTTVTATFKVDAIGAVTGAVNFTDNTNMVVGDIITFKKFGQYVVTTVTPGAPGTATLTNQTATPLGSVVPIGTVVSWQHIGTQLPPGRMGCYGLGRVWMSLVDGEQFVAGDLVGGSSGTQAENYRDSVLSITENSYLAGGGNFFVPGSVGSIQAMIFQAILDQQLGQGPLLVVTPTITFSCQAPLDRTTWTSVQNPIVTEGMIANGGMGQYSTIAVNGDTIMRAVDGIRSLILARRDFNTWGNTPISFEMNRVLPLDAPNLLPYSSAIFFDNRLMVTLAPTASTQGVYHKGLVVLNADPLSGIAGKAPSIWEGVWLGLQPLQLVTGIFDTVQRAWAFCLNTTTNEIELRELLAEGLAFDNKQYYDNGTDPITYILESAQLFKDPNTGDRKFKQLHNGEIFVDQLVGVVNFRVQYQPDQWPGWVDWFSWTECATPTNSNDPTTQNYQPGFQPRMGLGQPRVDDCDPCTNRPLRNGYSFQVRITITGQCRFLGARFECIPLPEPQFAPQVCAVPPVPPNLVPAKICGCPGLPLSVNITASGGTPPYVFTFPNGLPNGLIANSLNDTTVNLSVGVVPASFGTSSFLITVTDNNLQSSTQSFSMVIQGPSNNYTTPGQVGVPYSSQPIFSGGVAPYVVSLASGTLPTGLTLASDGTLSGTPSAAGTYDFFITDTDAEGCTCTTEMFVIINP